MNIKKILSLALGAMLLLGLIGCSQPMPPLDTGPATMEISGALETTIPPENTTPRPTPTVPATAQATEAADMPQSLEATVGKEDVQEQKPTDSQNTQPNKSTTEPPPMEPFSKESITTQPPTEAAEAARVEIDKGAIEAYARSYAQSLGFVIDTSLGKGNSGYYSPDYRPLYSTEEGCTAAAGMVVATKNQLNSRFSSRFCDVLVDSAYGNARMNCLVEFSHTDELGDWYYIYVFYG